MFSFIPILLQWLAPSMLTFFTPARCLAFFKAVVATIEFVSANHGDESADAQYQHGLAFLTAQYDLLDEVAGFDENIDKFSKETALPLLLSFIYGGNHNA